MDKSVALSVDGQKSTVHSFGGTVADVLDKQGIELGEHDVVTPSAQTSVDDGQTIVVRYGRKLAVTVDGKERVYWTTASTVGQALQELGIRGSEDAVLSASRSAGIGRDGLELKMSTPKDVTLVVAGKRSTATVTASTVKAALKEAEVRFDSNDLIKPGAAKAVTDGMTIRLDRVATKGAKRTESIPFTTVVKKDSSRYEGTSKVEREGRDGLRTNTVKLVYKNGKVSASKVTSSTVTRQPVSKVVLQGTKAKPKPKPAPVAPAPTASAPKAAAPKAAAPKASAPKTSAPAPSAPAPTQSTAGINLANAAMWDRIAQCESTGNWSINSGNGYYGGLQFDIGTWLGAGGGDFAQRADLASRAEQITVANRVKASRGLSPWGCAHAA